MQKYLIKVDGLAPVSLSYEIMAEDEQQAYQMLEKTPHLLVMKEKPFIDLKRMRKSKVVVINMFTGVVEFFRNL